MLVNKSKFLVNNDSSGRIMAQCRTLVNKDAIRHESVDGIDHIVVSSSTLPDDIVMNGGLYPKDEIEKSYRSLELTLSPVEHPVISDQFVSANDPRAIHKFHAGAFNLNVSRDGDRVRIDKYINVQEAMKTDRGKRLLDRIDELEKNENPRPIHTSVGVFLIQEILDKPKKNKDGLEYSWIARDMVFDHDAILLDSVGAAQPDQGVGIAVNQKGEEYKVKKFAIDEDLSFDDKYKSVADALEKSGHSGAWIEQLYDDRVIFSDGNAMFEVPYVTDDNGISTIMGIPLPVERVVSYVPKTNKSEGEKMKELILNALKKAGINTDGLSDEEILIQYNQIKAKESKESKESKKSKKSKESEGDETDIVSMISNAIEGATKPLVDKIDELESSLNEGSKKEIERLATIVSNSDKYPGLDIESAKLLGEDKLKEMAANCQDAFGLAPYVSSGSEDRFLAPSEMPN